MPLAPKATEMMFWPLLSTMMRAVPEGSFLSMMSLGVIPSFLRRASVARPKRSSPTLAMKEQAPFLPESLATATAWLAPLPPGFKRKRPPNIVSPGTGIFFPVMTMSVLVDPRTTIFLVFMSVVSALLVIVKMTCYTVDIVLYQPVFRKKKGRSGVFCRSVLC